MLHKSTLLLPTAINAIKCAPSCKYLMPTSELSCLRDCSTVTPVKLALLRSGSLRCSTNKRGGEEPEKLSQQARRPLSWCCARYCTLLPLNCTNSSVDAATVETRMPLLQLLTTEL